MKKVESGGVVVRLRRIGPLIFIYLFIYLFWRWSSYFPPPPSNMLWKKDGWQWVTDSRPAVTCLIMGQVSVPKNTVFFFLHCSVAGGWAMRAFHEDRTKPFFSGTVVLDSVQQTVVSLPSLFLSKVMEILLQSCERIRWLKWYKQIRV